MREFYVDLLKQWCDGLLALQITENTHKELHGGILCPSCARVHGRCADAIYPLVLMTKLTGDRKYLEAAKLAFDWAENMARPDGYYVNDTNSTWNGITVFATIQLGSALHYHGDLLDAETKRKWTDRLRLGVEYLYGADLNISNVNYPLTCSASLAIGSIVLKEEKYATKARENARQFYDRLTPEGLIFGEGKPQTAVTPKGCRPVDIGYNVEETLGGLTEYALWLGDNEMLDAVEKSLRAHLPFMLPDGAWDNSFGSRSNKWTYWGSRTSDGCQIAYGLMADRDPLFAKAAYQNALLLKKCTVNGLLHGGPMYYDANEPACSHHGFCHAKAIATLLDHDATRVPDGLTLPRADARGVSFYPSLDTYLVSTGSWRATVTGYDFDYVENGHPTGGSISMLWHEKTSAVLVGTMTHYSMVEPNNTQLPQYYGNIAQTPRIELKTDGDYFRSCADRTAALTCTESDGVVTAHATGVLRNGKHDGQFGFETEYLFSKDKITISAKTNAEGGVYKLPVAAGRKATVTTVDAHTVKIITDGAAITVKCSDELKIEPKAGGRVFNPVGGFLTVPLYAELARDASTVFTIWID